MTDFKKRKLPLTGQFWDPKGNRMHVAFDRGWGDPEWAERKSKSFIDSVVRIQPRAWIMVRIAQSTQREEVNLTKFLERLCETRSIFNRNFIIRTKSTNGNDRDVDSWVFIQGPDIVEIAEEIEHYLNAEVEIIGSERLGNELKRLFDAEMHPKSWPDGKRIRRWSASSTTRNQLIVSRLEQLMKMAERKKYYPFIEDVPAEASFEFTMAVYLKADRPLLFDAKTRDKISALEKLEEKRLITEDQMMTILRYYLRLKVDKKKLVLIYRGRPKDGAETDREDGRFNVHEGTHTVSSTWKSGMQPTEKEMEWETIPVPKPKPKEED